MGDLRLLGAVLNAAGAIQAASHEEIDREIENGLQPLVNPRAGGLNMESPGWGSAPLSREVSTVDDRNLTTAPAGV